jgi:Fe-S-cluster-containing dehydrogenase component
MRDVVRAPSLEPRATATASGRRATSTPGCAAWSRSDRPSMSWRASTSSTRGTTRTPRAPTGARLEMVRRQTTFEEIVQGLDAENVLFEAAAACRAAPASRATCYGVCPDNAVIKLGEPGERYAIDYDYCKGCGICVAECPSRRSRWWPSRSTRRRRSRRRVRRCPRCVAGARRPGPPARRAICAATTLRPRAVGTAARRRAAA